MAETTLLRQSAIVRNASVGTSPPLGPPRPMKTGELPLVQVKMAPGGPQVLTPQPRAVEILPPRDAESALRTGGLPMVCVKMTSQGPQIDDGQDKAVVILPSKDQRHAVAAGGLPMVQVKMTSGGPQVQNMPTAQKAPPQIQGPQPALSAPRGGRFAVPPSGQARVVRIAAPSSQVPLPPVPEFAADQLMLCRHLVGRYLADLRVVAPTGDVVGNAEPVDAAVQGATEAAGGSNAVVQGATEVSPAVDAAAAPGSDNERLAESTIELIDQALVAVAVRAEAAALAAVAASEAQAAPAVVRAASIIPAAPSASYVAGRVGGRPNGYASARVQRNASMAPRRVARTGSLPPVIVKMDGGRSVVQNQAEVAAAREAALAQRAEPETFDGDAQA